MECALDKKIRGGLAVPSEAFDLEIHDRAPAAGKEYRHAGAELEIRVFRRPSWKNIDVSDFTDRSEDREWMRRQMPEGIPFRFWNKRYWIDAGLFEYVGYADDADGFEDALRRGGFACAD